jgi:hypothetical protein
MQLVKERVVHAWRDVREDASESFGVVGAGLARSKAPTSALFYPEGVALDRNSINRTATTAPLFKYLEPAKGGEESLVALTGASWNQTLSCLRQIDGLRLQPEFDPNRTSELWDVLSAGVSRELYFLDQD